MTAASTAHPTWHFAVVALAAVLVFAGIKAHELWQARRSHVKVTLPVVLLAAASFSAAAIHVSVSPSHFREATIFGVFFAASAAAQAGWAVLVLMRPTRQVLFAGMIGNAAVVALWAVSRTVGLPIGPNVWQPEAVRTIDAVCTQFEVALALFAAWLLYTPVVRSASRQLSRPPVRRMARS